MASNVELTKPESNVQQKVAGEAGAKYVFAFPTAEATVGKEGVLKCMQK